MEKLDKSAQEKKPETKIHLISQLAGADTPPDIKKIFYPNTNEDDIT